MYFFITFVIMMAVWIVFSGQFDAFHLILGVLSSLFVAATSWRLFFPHSNKAFSAWITEIVRFSVYACWLLTEVVKANLHVLYLALSPAGTDQIRPEIVRFKLRLKSDMARYVLANSITLTPGTVTIKLEGDELLVHSISRKTTEGLEGDMEKRVAHVFGENLEEKGEIDA